MSDENSLTPPKELISIPNDGGELMSRAQGYSEKSFLARNIEALSSVAFSWVDERIELDGVALDMKIVSSARGRVVMLTTR